MIENIPEDSLLESCDSNSYVQIQLHDPYDLSVTHNVFDGSMLPTLVKSYYCIRYADPMKLLYQLSINVGKWMLFCDIKCLDFMWKKAINLYDAGLLTGILSIQSSTAMASARNADVNNGVISFVCGPEDNEENVKSFGRNVITLMDYKCERGWTYFKSESQSMTGTKATGQTRNNLYRLPCSKNKFPKIL